MAYYKTEGISFDGLDISVSIETEGVPEGLAEKVHLHGHDAVARALQAIKEGELPDDCDGLGFRIDWEGVIAGEYGEVEG